MVGAAGKEDGCWVQLEDYVISKLGVLHMDGSKGIYNVSLFGYSL